MSEAIAVALIGLAGSGIGSAVGVIASQRLTQYRIEQLEDKVDKHNSIIERTYKLEGRMTEVEHDIRDMKNERR